ncbi:MAG: type II secretion system F family protein, partial [Nevskia sp.]|nr:type II secretion system F family protein [Nevskia sp.]
MAAFEFTALDAGGRNSKGLIEGDTPRQVRQLLRERGLTPLDVREVAAGKAQQGGSFSLKQGGSLNSTELALFTRQLATLTRSGLPLDEALTAVSQQSESKRVQRVTLGVRARV